MSQYGFSKPGVSVFEYLPERARNKRNMMVEQDLTVISSNKVSPSALENLFPSEMQPPVWRRLLLNLKYNHPFGCVEMTERNSDGLLWFCIFYIFRRVIERKS